MDTHLNYSGFVIAGIGFFLTRFTVTLAVSNDPTRFYIAGVIPLALGLSLASFGVVLAVADVDSEFVRTTASWCVVGTGTMLVLALLTVLGSVGTESLSVATIRSQSDLSTFLIGGSLGGTLTGLYAARNRQQRTVLQQQTTRLVVLNHMLRHKILNALTPIRGFGAVDHDNNPQAGAIIENRAADIEQTVEEVRYFTKRAGLSEPTGSLTNLKASLEAAAESIRNDYPDATVLLEDVPQDLEVTADDRLPFVFTHLLENAIVHGQDTAPSVDVTETPSSVRVSVHDNGPGLPVDQQRLLETGDIDEYDKLDMGFGLDLVRLFTESYSTEIETAVTDEGTTIMLDFPRTKPEVAGRPVMATGLSGIRGVVPQVLVVLTASVLAGVVYGIVSETLGGSISAIGVFYGTASPIVGWLTHEFHSVVFGFMFLAIISVLPAAYRNNPTAFGLVGLGWGVLLWIVAAGIIAPIWLQLIGIPASIPNLSIRLLVNHVAWGLSLGLLTAAGSRFIVRWSDRGDNAPEDRSLQVR